MMTIHLTLTGHDAEKALAELRSNIQYDRLDADVVVTGQGQTEQQRTMWSLRTSEASGTMTSLHASREDAIASLREYYRDETVDDDGKPVEFEDDEDFLDALKDAYINVEIEEVTVPGGKE